MVAGSASGEVHLITKNGSEWNTPSSYPAHKGKFHSGVVALSFGPSAFLNTQELMTLEPDNRLPLEPLRFLSASPDDNKVCIFEVRNEVIKEGDVFEQKELVKDFITDSAW